MTGPRVVALGGGHGLAASLQAARTYAGALTAIVSVADDGGSSGRLRAERPDLPAPGDVRRCICALADPASALGRTLEHRFAAADGGLDGHAFGNLLLATLTTELGSFGAAVDEVARLVGAAGRVLPATTGAVALDAHLRVDVPTPSSGGSGGAGEERLVRGQVAVQNASGVATVSLRPAHPPSSPAVAEAILAADQVVIGPGSLFTSVLAAAVVPAVRRALHDTSARRVYVANLSPQVPETAGFSLADHVAALADHDVPLDVVLAHDRGPSGAASDLGPGIELVQARLADDRGLVHHPERLGRALAALA